VSHGELSFFGAGRTCWPAAGLARPACAGGARARGWYAVALHWGSGRPDGYLQLLAGIVKLPALFLCTLAVTFPSLFVFSSLAGVDLDLAATLRMLVSAIVVNLAVAASLGTILAFFTLSTTSYPFMVVLNVTLLGVAGSAGLGFLRRTLTQLAAPSAGSEPGAAANASERTTSAWADPNERAPRAQERASRPHDAARSIFRVWTVIYALVGMQMGWLLRPFIGHPQAAFSLFRPRAANFFVGLFDNLGRMFGT
jgi:hypothetical protein